MKLNLGILGIVRMTPCSYVWEKRGMTIIYDGHTDYGLRIHVVDSYKYHGMILDNALILCHEYL